MAAHKFALIISAVVLVWMIFLMGVEGARKCYSCGNGAPEPECKNDDPGPTKTCNGDETACEYRIGLQNEANFNNGQIFKRYCAKKDKSEGCHNAVNMAICVCNTEDFCNDQTYKTAAPKAPSKTTPEAPSSSQSSNSKTNKSNAGKTGGLEERTSFQVSIVLLIKYLASCSVLFGGQ